MFHIIGFNLGQDGASVRSSTHPQPTRLERNCQRLLDQFDRADQTGFMRVFPVRESDGTVTYSNLLGKSPSTANAKLMEMLTPSFVVGVEEERWLDRGVVVHTLQQSGFKEVDGKSTTFADVVIMQPELRHDQHRIYALFCAYRNFLLSDAMTNKIELHKMLTKVAPGIIPETHCILSRKLQKPPSFPGPEGTPWIWRPEEAGGGRGISVVTTQAELDEVWRAHAHRQLSFRIGAPPGSRLSKRALLSKYIADPLLFKGQNGCATFVHGSQILLFAYIFLSLGPTVIVFK